MNNPVTDLEAHTHEELKQALARLIVQRQDVILDVGCGGGRTVNKLAAMASEGRVYGIDFSRTSVAVALPHSEHKPAVPMYQYSVGLPHLSQYSGLGYPQCSTSPSRSPSNGANSCSTTRIAPAIPWASGTDSRFLHS